MNHKTDHKKNKIAGIGEMLWDIHGETKFIGGAPANFACHCAALGASASVISCVGNDELGKLGINFLNQNGVNTEAINVDNKLETGVVNVLLDSKGI